MSPAPFDVTAGLILDGSSFFKIQKEDPKLLKYKVGIGGEILVNENLNNIHVLDLQYLPNAPAVARLDILKKIGTRFGFLVQNDSSPRYKGISSNCRILEKPVISPGGKGFADSVWKILMIDYTDSYLDLVK